MTPPGSAYVRNDDARAGQAAAQESVPDADWRALVDHAPTVVFVTDRDSRLLLHNPSFAVLFGRPGEALAGLYVGDVVESDLAQTLRRQNQVIFEGGQALALEHHIATADAGCAC